MQQNLITNREEIEESLENEFRTILLSKENGEVTGNRIPCTSRFLNITDVPVMSEFSKTIYSRLTGEVERKFIHQHSEDYYRNIFLGIPTANQKFPEQVHYIGFFANGQLVGMSYLMICEDEQQLKGELPNSPYDFFKSDRNGKEVKVASFGGDSVLPAYRGNNLNGSMIECRLRMAKKLGCTDCTAIVDRNNRWNMPPYFSNGFNLFATTIDPDDGGPISLLHKPIVGGAALPEDQNIKVVRISVPYHRLDLIDDLVMHNNIGIAFNKATGCITFAPSGYYNQKHRPANIMIHRINTDFILIRYAQRVRV